MAQYISTSLELTGEAYVGDKIEGVLTVNVASPEPVRLCGAVIEYRVTEWHTFSHNPMSNFVGDYDMRVGMMRQHEAVTRNGSDAPNDAVFYEADYWLFGQSSTAFSRGKHPVEVAPGTYSYPFAIPIPPHCPPTAHFGTHAGPQLHGILPDGPQVIVDHKLRVVYYVAGSFDDKRDGTTVLVKRGIPEDQFEISRNNPRQYHVKWPGSRFECNMTVENDGVVVLGNGTNGAIPIRLRFQGTVGAGQLALVRAVQFKKGFIMTPYKVYYREYSPERTAHRALTPSDSTEEHFVAERATNGSSEEGTHQITMQVPIANIEDAASFNTHELEVSYFLTFATFERKQRLMIPIMFVHRVHPPNFGNLVIPPPGKYDPPPSHDARYRYYKPMDREPLTTDLNDAVFYRKAAASTEEPPIELVVTTEDGAEEKDRSDGGGGGHDDQQQQAPTLYGSNSNTNNDTRDETNTEKHTDSSKE